MSPLVPIQCVGAVIHDGQGRILLVRRGHDPGRGLWSIPGGRVEPGETDEDAVMREVREETGLEITVGRYLGVVQRPAPDGRVFEIQDYLAVPVHPAPEPFAGDDADDVRWVSLVELDPLPLVDGLRDALLGWSALPRPE